MKRKLFCLVAVLFFSFYARSQDGAVKLKKDSLGQKTRLKAKILFGTASYYADKFNGRETANGEIYDGNKMTAACNVLPLGTWIRVTNLNNNRSVIVKT